MRTLLLFVLVASLAACGGNDAPASGPPVIKPAPSVAPAPAPAPAEQPAPAPAQPEVSPAPQALQPSSPPPLPPAVGIDFNPEVGQAAFSNYLATLGYRDANLAGNGLTGVTATVASWNDFSLSQCLPPPPPSDGLGIWCTATGVVSVDYRLGNEVRSAQPMEVTGRMFFSKKPDGWRLEAWNPRPAS